MHVSSEMIQKQICSLRRIAMKLKDILTVAGTAGITMAIALVTLGPRTIIPAYAVPDVRPVIQQPQFTSHGCRFSLKTDRPIYEAGQLPVFEITETNLSDNPVNATVWLSMATIAPKSLGSRMAEMPRTRWMYECAVNLLPKETRKIEVQGDFKLQSGQVFFVNITDKKDTIRLEGPEVRPDEAIRQQPGNIVPIARSAL
jgi:hypothetical protein